MRMMKCISDLDKILMRFLTVPLTLSSGPPGLPVLHSVLLAPSHPEHILLPVRLERSSSGHLTNELHVGEAAEEFLDCVVGDTVRSAEVSEGFVLNSN